MPPREDERGTRDGSGDAHKARGARHLAAPREEARRDGRDEQQQRAHDGESEWARSRNKLQPRTRFGRRGPVQKGHVEDAGWWWRVWVEEHRHFAGVLCTCKKTCPNVSVYTTVGVGRR